MPVSINDMEKVNGGMEPLIVEQKVTWTDGAGNVHTYTRREQEMPDIISQKVTYTDGNGTAYVISQ